MATIFVQHPVADYDAWRPHYGEDEVRREEAGLTEMGVYRDAADPNVILMAFAADDTSGFMTMLEPEGLREKMQAAGVQGRPKYWIAE
jgi:hypothetical protein